MFRNPATTQSSAQKQTTTTPTTATTQAAPTKTFEEAKHELESSMYYPRLKQMYPNLDFDEELQSNPLLVEHILSAISSSINQLEDPKTLANAPKLDEDFSRYFVINNLPPCDEAQSKKIIGLIETTLQKLNMNITGKDIYMPFASNGKTQGVAFVLTASEEQAKQAAAALNGFKLSAKYIFAASQFNDFEKIMQTSDTFEASQNAKLIDLRSFLLDTKREQYFFQRGKEILIKWHQAETTTYQQENSGDLQDELVSDEQITSDRTATWSPKGTYLISIKHDKIEFFGGVKMQPIITFPISKVEQVLMSPCERYVITYAPQSKEPPFIVWNFQMVEQIRSFDQKQGESLESFKWSNDGNYLAKKLLAENESPIEEGKIKCLGLSVYAMPTCDLLQNSEGLKKSINIEGVRDFQWSPLSNQIIYTAFPDEEQTNLHPKVGFLEIPSRQQQYRSMVHSQDLRIYAQKQGGGYVAIMNEYKEKKSTFFSIEIFDTTKPSLPHQKIIINREVLEFRGIFWETNYNKLAIHTISKKIVEQGKKDYSIKSKRNGLDFYEVFDDPIQGFIVKTIGNLVAEIDTMYWAGCKDIFMLIENENHKYSLHFYMIIKETASGSGATQSNQGGQKQNKLGSQEEKFEFKKIARHDISERKLAAQWDPSGRYLAVYGLKSSTIDRAEKPIKFFNILGVPLSGYDKVPLLFNFSWRPRQVDILKKKDIEKLKKEYKQKFVKIFQEEDKQKKKSMNQILKQSKKKVRDEFMTKFFLPLRKEFEEQREQYEKLWPISKQDLVEVETEVIFSYDNVIKETKI